MPVGRERLDQLVDRALRAHVDSARRLVGEQELRRLERATSRTGSSAGCHRRASRRRASSRLRGARRRRRRISLRRGALAARVDDDGRAARPPPGAAASRSRRTERIHHAGPGPCGLRQQRDAATDRAAGGGRPSARAHRSRSSRSRGRRRRSARTTSERRCPTSPASPTISPRRTSSETSCDDAGGRESPRTESTTGASVGGGTPSAGSQLERAPEHRGDERVRRLVGGR